MPQLDQHQVLWSIVIKKLIAIFGKSGFFYTFLATLSIVAQGLYLNYVVNKYHFFSKRTYLPAYTYILLTCLLKEWGTFSVEMINNWLFLWLLNLVYSTYADQNARKSLFNIGCLYSLLMLLSFPNVLFIFFITIALLILRPFKLVEWMVTLLGMITPVYILGGLAYLTDSLYIFSDIFSVQFTLPKLLNSQTVIALSALGLLSIIGFVLLNQQMNRMLFQIKKLWWINIIFLFISILSTIPIFTLGNEIWIVTLLPASLFIMNVWFVQKPKWFAETMNMLLLATAIYLQWFYY
ncbi:DUF6427 family protein [Taibaiella sp. KBW10]|uniref:DUF6427 family protein n=1 Tax=Taibaiella sp. KBW10 TaxID=2153357 RepID=UPI000F5A55B7|nr:DUF6427 family protein [Taibaiella sp. KBW10]